MINFIAKEPEEKYTQTGYIFTNEDASIPYNSGIVLKLDKEIKYPNKYRGALTIQTWLDIITHKDNLGFIITTPDNIKSLYIVYYFLFKGYADGCIRHSFHFRNPRIFKVFYNDFLEIGDCFDMEECLLPSIPLAQEIKVIEELGANMPMEYKISEIERKLIV